MSAILPSYTDQPAWKRELAWAAGLIAAGLFVLPPCVYWVGQIVIGEYGPDLGLWDMMLHIWSDSAQGGLLAWMLVLSPYLLVQLWRVHRHLRHRLDVNSVTDSADQT